MFCRQLYMDNDTSKDFKSLRHKFRDKKYPAGIYVIALSKHCSRVECYDSKLLKYKFYNEEGNEPFIIGLAKGKESALHIMQGIVEDVYKETGTVDVTSYLKERSAALARRWNSRYNITVINQESET